MDTNKEKYDFNDLVEVIRVLRSPEGCPWDREQTHDSLKKNLIEESYELINEFEKENVEGMKEELGDVLLQVMLHSQIAKDEGHFDINDVIDGITKKMLYRHPHVFEKQNASNSEEAYNLFMARKNKEKSFGTQTDVLKSIPESFPALIKNYKIAQRLHKIQPDVFNHSFDEHLNKVYEELEELKKAYKNNDKLNIEEELGDVLCTVVSTGEFIGVDSEIALNTNCKKVINRIDIIESKLLKEGEKMPDLSSDKFIKYWEEAKILEKKEKV
jgi:tetrapyrrole methylase family protein/MazG family protein